MPHREIRAFDVCIEMVVKEPFVDLLDGRKAAYSRIDEENVQAAPALAHFGGHALDLAQAGEIAAHELQAFRSLAAARNDDARALVTKQLRRRQADAGRTAGDERNLAVEFLHA